jgi:excisionase family DNA binding protein
MTILREREAASLLGVSVQTLRRLRKAGTGPRHFRIGRNILYRRGDVIAWTEVQ